MEVEDWDNVLYNEWEQKLTLISQSLTHLPAAIVDHYSHRARHLDLSYNSISDLNWLGAFSNLETLILDRNTITDEHFAYLGTKAIYPFENITTLSLNNNKLKDLSFILKILKEYFPNLQYLSLLKNPLCPDGLSEEKTNSLTYEMYREDVYKTLKEIKFLDYMKISKYYEESIPQLRPVILKFSFKVALAKLINNSSRSKYNPLPDTPRAPGDHYGKYGVSLYKYKGNHSEGNRFIMNNDL